MAGDGQKGAQALRSLLRCGLGGAERPRDHVGRLAVMALVFPQPLMISPRQEYAHPAPQGNSRELSMNEAVRPVTPIGRVVLASFIGTSIEWYDFFLYGTAA